MDKKNDMEKDVFRFRVRNLSFGWCRVVMHINDKVIEYNASYLGDNPLASMIDACADYLIEDGKYHISWLAEPGMLQIDMDLDENKMLHLDITNTECENEEYHETIPYDSFLSAIISEGFRVLNAFGLNGYQNSWLNHGDFPLTNLIRITNKCSETWKGDSCCTDLSKEMECLQKHISSLAITEETKMDECVIYYESWQIQCCGDPFAVGDHVEWTCVMPEVKNAHGIVIDMEEEHHGFATHSATGTVSKIIAERSEFPKGEREVWYERAKTIHEEIQHADGWESEIKDDDTTERMFWGYIVELKDATVKPLGK